MAADWLRKDPTVPATKAVRYSIDAVNALAGFRRADGTVAFEKSTAGTLYRGLDDPAADRVLLEAEVPHERPTILDAKDPLVAQIAREIRQELGLVRHRKGPRKIVSRSKSTR